MAARLEEAGEDAMLSLVTPSALKARSPLGVRCGGGSALLTRVCVSPA